MKKEEKKTSPTLNFTKCDAKNPKLAQDIKQICCSYFSTFPLFHLDALLQPTTWLLDNMQFNHELKHLELEV